MKKIIGSITFFLSFLLSITQAQAQAKLVQSVAKKGDEIVIPFQKYILPNGLTVILTEDHSDPIIHVDVTYHVGSVREEIGKSGFAHFFEHMMFEGSYHVPSGVHFKTINASGGTLNGGTNHDRTSYYETIPNNQLEKVLWLEADRMGFLLDAVTTKKFENQRSTVKNERGQNYDNRAYGLASEAISKALYPYGNPYSWLTIGYIEDLNRADLNDLKHFFLRWYVPNNATLTIGGDINPKQTLAWVEKYFGTIPRGMEVKPTVLPLAVISSDRYISYTDNYAKLPRLCISYPGVRLFHKDAVALDALSQIIGQDVNSILYKNLIKAQKASAAFMSSSNFEAAGEINIYVSPFPGQSLAEIKKIVDESLKDFEQKDITEDDLTSFKSSAKSLLFWSLSSISGKVSSLALAQTFTDNPNHVGQELKDINNVTKADVIRVYNKYIKGKGAVVLSVLPKGGAIKPAAADNYIIDSTNYKAPEYGYDNLTYHKAKDNFNRNLMPPAGNNPVIKVPKYWTATTGNGIKILGSFNNEIQKVSIHLSLKGGGLLALKNPSKAGLPGVVAQMLNDETQQHTAEQMSTAIKKLGSVLRASASAEKTTFYISSFTNNLDATLALLQERLFHPKFTQVTLDRIKKQILQGFQNDKTEASAIADNVYNKILYGYNNIRISGLHGNGETVKNITLADVQGYYDNNFAPNLVSIVVVGDVSEVTIRKKLSFLNSWKEKQVEIPSPEIEKKPVEKNTLYIVNIPGAAQSVIRLGYQTGIPYDATGLYYKLGLVNYPLGGGFTSRLNANLREERGWTYGASSGFASSRSGDRFTAAANVKALATDSAVVAFLKDISMYANNGITSAELAFTKSSIGQSQALLYETNDQKVTFLSRIQDYKLPPNFVEEQSRILGSIEKNEVDALARKYLDISEMSILVVGDKAVVLPGLQKLGYKVVELDTDGKVK